jgi:phosphatidate cytidylyltransferase
LPRTLPPILSAKPGENIRWPQHQPQKNTGRGYGGILGSVIVSLLTVWLFEMPINYGYAIVLAIAVSIFGQAGDLFRIPLQTKYGDKRLGNSIPGHGGFLDVWTASSLRIIVYYYVILLGG